jgi:hypothetical protein
MAVSVVGMSASGSPTHFAIDIFHIIPLCWHVESVGRIDCAMLCDVDLYCALTAIAGAFPRLFVG